MVQAVIQWEKHEKMNNLYVKRMQSVLYSQGGVQLPKLGVNFTEKGGAATASQKEKLPTSQNDLTSDCGTLFPFSSKQKYVATNSHYNNKCKGQLKCLIRNNIYRKRGKGPVARIFC